MEKIDRKFCILAVNPANGHIYTEQDSLLLCAKDVAVVPALKAYRDECERIGANEAHILSVNLLIERVAKYQNEVNRKIPDTIGAIEIGRCLRGEGV